MSSQHYTYTGENLESKWINFETKPHSAKLRIYTVIDAANEVRGSVALKAKELDSQRKAAELIEKEMPVEAPSAKEDRSPSSESINLEYVNEGPVRNKELVKQAVQNSESAERESDARARIAKVHGEQRDA